MGRADVRVLATGSESPVGGASRRCMPVRFFRRVQSACAHMVNSGLFLRRAQFLSHFGRSTVLSTGHVGGVGRYKKRLTVYHLGDKSPVGGDNLF